MSAVKGNGIPHLNSIALALIQMNILLHGMNHPKNISFVAERDAVGNIMVMMMVVIQWMCVVEGKQETTLFLRIFTRQSFDLTMSTVLK